VTNSAIEDVLWLKGYRIQKDATAGPERNVVKRNDGNFAVRCVEGRMLDEIEKLERNT